MELDQTTIDQGINNTSILSLNVEQQVPEQYEQKSRTDTISLSTKNIEKSSLMGASINFYKCCMGSGVLAMPYVFVVGGWLQSLILYIMIPLMVIYSTNSVIFTGEEYLQKKGLGFSATTRLILGDRVLNILKVLLILMQWGCCASYMLFFMSFFEYSFYHNNVEIPIKHELLYFVFSLFLIIPLVLINNVAIFSKYSIISSIITVMVLFGISGYGIQLMANGQGYYETQKNDLFQWNQVFFQSGIAMYAFEGIGLIYPIKNSMKEENKFHQQLIIMIYMNFKSVVTYIGILLMVQNCMFSVLASFAFGPLTDQIILLSLPQNWFSGLLQISYSIALLITFPLQLFPVFEMIESTAFIRRFIQENTRGYILRRTLIRVFQVVLISLFAVGVPQFALLLSFIGGFSSSSLQFGFPFAVYIKCRWQRDGFRQRLIMTLISSLGIVLGIGATIDSMVKIAQ